MNYYENRGSVWSGVLTMNHDARGYGFDSWHSIIVFAVVTHAFFQLYLIYSPLGPIPLGVTSTHVSPKTINKNYRLSLRQYIYSMKIHTLLHSESKKIICINHFVFLSIIFLVRNYTFN